MGHAVSRVPERLPAQRSGATWANVLRHVATAARKATLESESGHGRAEAPRQEEGVWFAERLQECDTLLVRS